MQPMPKKEAPKNVEKECSSKRDEHSASIDTTNLG
jgi:hypothetical protein